MISLALAIDEYHQILGCKLTLQEVDDPAAAVPDMLAQIATSFDTFIADGAYGW